MRRFFAALSLFAFALAGCDGNGATGVAIGGSGGVAGTYTLRTIATNTLPYTYLTSGADTYEVLDGTFTLADGGSYTRTQHERHTISGTANLLTFSDAGTFTLNGTTITITRSTSEQAVGSLSGSTLTFAGRALSGGPLLTMTFTR
jgi:hypothetical protein